MTPHRLFDVAPQAREAVRQWHVTDEGKLAREIDSCARADMELIPETVEATSTAEGIQTVVDLHGVTWSSSAAPVRRESKKRCSAAPRAKSSVR